MTEKEKKCIDDLVTKWYYKKFFSYGDMNIIIKNLYADKFAKFNDFLAAIISLYQIPYKSLPLFCKTHRFKKILTKNNYRFNETINSNKDEEIINIKKC